MEIETIWLESDDISNLMYDDNDDYTHIDCITEYTDLEKSYKKVTIIIQRNSDGKYFKGIIKYDSDYDANIYEEFKQVYPVEKTVVVYE